VYNPVRFVSCWHSSLEHLAIPLNNKKSAGQKKTVEKRFRHNMFKIYIHIIFSRFL
jgi:hypothetical protein